MATPVSPPPIDVAAIFQRVLDEYRDPRGLLPLELARTSSGTLDAAVREDMIDRGLDRYDAAEYESTLRSEIEELLTQPNEVKTLAGQELADAADLLAGDAPSYEAYAEALEDAGDALRVRGRRDVLDAFRRRVSRDTILALAELKNRVGAKSYRVQ